MPREAIQITSHPIDRRPTRPPSAPRLNPPRTTPPRGQTCTHSKFKHLSTRWRGWSRAGREPSSIYIYSHTRARVLVMGVHTSRLRDTTTTHRVPPLPDPIARVDRGARDRGAGRSRAGGCLSVCLFTGRDSRTSPRIPAAPVPRWARGAVPPARGFDRRRRGSWRRSETTRPRPRSRTHGRARSVHARHVRFVAFDPPSNARSSPLGRTHARARARIGFG